MRSFVVCLLAFTVQLSFAQGDFDFFSTAHDFFRVQCKNGKVDYPSIKDDKYFDTLINHIANDDIPKDKEKAYLINAYNLLVINKVIKNFPIQSPLDIPSFFKVQSETLAGQKISLDYLEKQLLMKKHKDPRLHFVLVCGALGCPPIADFAYNAEILNNQIEEQTRKALNSHTFLYQNNEEEKIYLSEIFKWYAEDFGKNNEEIISYINAYKYEMLNKSYQIAFYTYNWNLNTSESRLKAVSSEKKPESTDLQLYTAGSLLAKGKMDFTLFNSLYTENKSNWLDNDYSGFRNTFVTHLFQFTIGVTKGKRVNIGVDMNVKYSSSSSDSTFGGVKNAFAFKNNDSTRVGLTSAGVRLKVQPFKSVKDFSIQSTLLIPTIENPEGISQPAQQNLYWADWDRITWWNQLFYAKNFKKFQLFTELDFLFRFKRNTSQIGMLDIPVSIFLSYFPTKRITIYAMTQHLHRYTNNITPNNPEINDWVIPANYTNSGVGFKYQILSNLNVELLYTNFWRAQNSGLGQTFNLGLKYITK